MLRVAGALLAVVLIAGAGCGPVPPSDTDNLSSDWTSIGSFRLHAEGDDSTARSFISNNNWRVYKGHNGGTGDTLQIVNQSGGIVLIWAANSFGGYELGPGWTGTTPNGAAIGTALSTFQQLEPEFTQAAAPDQLQAAIGRMAVMAEFQNGQLSRIRVIDYD